MKIAIGNDQHGLAYKQMLLSTFAEHEFVDMGSYDTHCRGRCPQGGFRGV